MGVRPDFPLFGQYDEAGREHEETTKQERTEEHRCNIIRMLYDLENADVLNYVRIIIEDIVKERGIEV